ncbi:MAG: universal stress protein, partial [Rhodovarius sp.]|nr:universal stress protein [Rhodovarius sp.]
MKLADILVLLDGSPASHRRLEIACGIAARHEAHVIGLRCIDPIGRAMLYGDAGGGYGLSALIEALRKEALEKAAAIEADFQETAARFGVGAEWRLVEAAAVDVIALHGRYADLIVMGQPDREQGGPGVDAVVEQALFASGRPVMVAPFAGGPAEAGKRVLIGWNASREAARAVHDALPLLLRAEAVTVFAANPEQGISGHGDVPGADIARHLARHGVKVEVRQAFSDELSPGEMMLNLASDLGVDLIVMGGYGHSRWRELVLGGVTRTMLR